MPPRLTVLVPTRGRPQNVFPILEQWRATGAFSDGAEIVFIVDQDDPALYSYMGEIQESPDRGVSFVVESEWRPLVPKLNRQALIQAKLSDRHIGFAGDDHLPRTEGWARQYIEALDARRTGVVSCPDGYRRDDLPTQWAMTSDIVRELGRMVPAPVEHLYCDNAVRDLAKCAHAYSWLPDVLIEHMHPFAGKADSDDGYATVNSPERYSADKTSYAIWTYRAMRLEAARVRALKESGVG